MCVSIGTTLPYKIPLVTEAKIKHGAKSEFQVKKCQVNYDGKARCIHATAVRSMISIVFGMWASQSKVTTHSDWTQRTHYTRCPFVQHSICRKPVDGFIQFSIAVWLKVHLRSPFYNVNAIKLHPKIFNCESRPSEIQTLNDTFEDRCIIPSLYIG